MRRAVRSLAGVVATISLTATRSFPILVTTRYFRAHNVITGVLFWIARLLAKRAHRGAAGGFGLVVGIDRGAGADALEAAGADIVVADCEELLP